MGASEKSEAAWHGADDLREKLASLPPSHPVHHFTSSATITQGRCACGAHVNYDAMAEHIAFMGTSNGEAERRWPVKVEPYEPTTWTIHSVMRQAFVEGAAWQAQHPTPEADHG